MFELIACVKMIISDYYDSHDYVGILLVVSHIYIWIFIPFKFWGLNYIKILRNKERKRKSKTNKIEHSVYAARVNYDGILPFEAETEILNRNSKYRTLGFSERRTLGFVSFLESVNVSSGVCYWSAENVDGPAIEIEL